jgi:predicted TIM-barrel fold metal-dependent hydrolase
MIIDIHPHIISDDTDRYPINPIGGKRSDWSRKNGTLTVEQYVEAMQNAGVDKAVVVHSSTTYGYDNSYVADSVEKYPGLLLGVGSIDLMADDVLEKLEYWVEKRHLVGFRLFTRGTTMGQTTWLDNPKTFPAWDWIQEHDLPVCVQISIPGLPMLKNIMLRFPRLRLILDHAASPELEDGPPYKNLQEVLALSNYPELYLKIATTNLRAASLGKSTPADFLRVLVSEFGMDRLAWGSNFPASEGSLDEHVRLALDAVSEFSPAERDTFLGGTAAKLYGI